MGYSVAEARACCKESGINTKVGISVRAGIGAEIGINTKVGIRASFSKNTFRPF